MEPTHRGDGKTENKGGRLESWKMLSYSPLSALIRGRGDICVKWYKGWLHTNLESAYKRLFYGY